MILLIRNHLKKPKIGYKDYYNSYKWMNAKKIKKLLCILWAINVIVMISKNKLSTKLLKNMHKGLVHFLLK